MSDRVILAAREPAIADGTLATLKRTFPGEVVVVHVDTDAGVFLDRGSGAFVAVPDGDPTALFQPLLDELREQGLVARLRIERGPVAESLARAAEAEQARLIVFESGAAVPTG